MSKPSTSLSLAERRGRFAAAKSRASGTALHALQESMGYFFRDESLLKGALRHSSFPTKGGSKHGFDRLEFLGDRVLNMLVARRLYESFLEESEGDLSHRYTALVCYETCAEVANEIDLGTYLEVAPGTTFEDFKILGDALEALLGAMFLDGGLEPCQVFVDRHWHDRLLAPVRPPQDAKSALQERVQALGKELPVYDVIDKRGSEHEPLFVVKVSVTGIGSAQGQGSSKKMAEKDAALHLLEQLGEG